MNESIAEMCLEGNKLSNLLTNENIKKLYNLFLKVSEALKKVVKKVREILKNIIDNVDIDKYKKFIKYQKRVRNRNKLYIKRKQKYGKGKKNGKRKSKRINN
jgi:hypothetical protein